MKKVIAFCTENEPFKANKFLDKVWCKQFPGSSWLLVFAEIASTHGYHVISGDIALSMVMNRELDPTNILVISENDSSDALKLINLGAEGSVLLCFESPYFVWQFYDNLPNIAKLFHHTIVFRGAVCGGQTKKHKLRFCCFDPDDIIPLVDWKQRKFLCIVASLRFSKPSFRQIYTNPKSYLFWIREAMRKWFSRSFWYYSLRNELQSKRLEAIRYFGMRDRIAVFGRGWDNIEKIPQFWQRSLNHVLQKIRPQPCEDKISTISSFRFSICFENVAFPGYVTEKIIDCFVAGVIPIYLGAPDILDFVPANAFIDMRNFSRWSDLETYLDSISEQQALEMISAGRKFLSSNEGMKHTHESFARFVMELVNVN